MAQTGYTPIQLYYSSTTTNVPLAASLANGELAINITDGKLFYKDNANAVQVIGWKVVPATAGGTGQTSYAVGDLIYADTTTTLAKLPDVATGSALISGGVNTAPSWGKIGLTTHVSGVLPVANGGTNASAASITAFNNITGYTASGATGTTSTNLVFSTSPSITTPTLVGDVTASTGNININGSGKGLTAEFVNATQYKGVFQARRIDTPSGAGTLTLTISFSTTFYGYVDFSIFGSFGASNREGEAAYRVYFQRGNVITKTVTAPENNNGTFTTSFSFSASSSSGSTDLTITMGKPSGAVYQLIINAQGSLSDYTATTSFA
jgi:hypothetical protein